MATKTTYTGGQSMPALGTPQYNASVSSPISTQSASIAKSISSSNPAASAPQYVNPTTGTISKNLQNFNAGIANGVSGTPTGIDENTAQPSGEIGTGTPAPYSGVSLVDALNQAGQPSDFASRKALATSQGISNYTGTAEQNTSLLNQYKQGLALANQSGVVSPSGQGAGASGVTQFMNASTPEGQYDMSNVNTVLETEPIYAEILDSFAELMSPEKQTQSLVEQYQSLVKTSGLEGINAQLINTQKIIENTESDIRSEITAVSGFSTNSQILAMSSARNKVLIQNYNGLLATRDSIQEQIQTTLQLSQEDRKMANDRIAQQLDLGFKIMDYRDKFVRNSQENYNNIVAQVGYDGLLTATNNDPYYISLVERSLNLAPGGLSQLAQQATLKQQSEARLAERESRLSGGVSSGSSGGGITITDGNIEEQIANLKLSTAQKSDLVDIQTLGTQIADLENLAADGILEGIGGLYTGSAKQFAFKNFSIGSEEGGQVRTIIGNIKGQIAKLRGGTSFTANEEKLLDSYVPGINETTKSVLNKIQSLKSFLQSKQDAIISVGGGISGGSNDPLQVR